MGFSEYVAVHPHPSPMQWERGEGLITSGACLDLQPILAKEWELKPSFVLPDLVK